MFSHYEMEDDCKIELYEEIDSNPAYSSSSENDESDQVSFHSIHLPFDAKS